MAGKVQVKREALRERLVQLAEERIAQHGLAALRARELAEDAGCALGSIYNIFADMDALVLEVNARTLHAVDTVMEKALAETAKPDRQLHALGQAYLKFARQHPLLWRGLFEHHLPEGLDLLEWYAALLMQLMGRIAEPLARLQPQLPSHVVTLRARTMFAAVHGVVSISLDNRFVGLAPDTLESELERFIQLLLDGVIATV